MFLVWFLENSLRTNMNTFRFVQNLRRRTHCVSQKCHGGFLSRHGIQKGSNCSISWCLTSLYFRIFNSCWGQSGSHKAYRCGKSLLLRSVPIEWMSECYEKKTITDRTQRTTQTHDAIETASHCCCVRDAPTCPTQERCFPVKQELQQHRDIQSLQDVVDFLESDS